MNNFCTCLTDALSIKFNVEAIVFVSKKKKHIHLLLDKPLFEYHNYKSILTFIRKYFEERRFFCEPYILNFPRINQSIMWRHDYILAIKKEIKSCKLWMLYWTGSMKTSNIKSRFSLENTILKYPNSILSNKVRSKIVINFCKISV